MSVNAYDIRQLRAMLDKIQRYEDGKIIFGELIQDLDSLLLAMENPNRDWKYELHSHWFTLEIYYALALDHCERGCETTPFELDEDGHIPEAIEIIKFMIRSELEKHSRELLDIVEVIKTKFSPEDVQHIARLIENDECELAFETASALIDDCNISITKDIFLRLENYAKK